MVVPIAPTGLGGARCVVTGGLGFIGSNVVHALVRAGASVTVVDALVPEHGGDPANVAGLPVAVVEADIGNAAATVDALREADAVFNVAGQVSHLASMHDPLHDLDLNTRSHLALLETLRSVNPRARVVLTSTRQVYGRPHYLPVDEAHPTEPVDVNGVSKLAGEQLHLLYARVHDMPISALRLTNVYGPRQCLHRDGLGFLPVFVRRALAGEEITVFGDGSQLRDCLHVDDVVRALVAAVQRPEAVGEVCNLGHHEVHSLLELARMVQGAAGGGGAVRLVPWPHELSRIDIGSFHGSYAKAERLLGWRPTVAFAEGMAQTIDFYRAGTWSPSST
jgi:nucleoside-diphosphate-sugar epimerase